MAIVLKTPVNGEAKVVGISPKLNYYSWSEIQNIIQQGRFQEYFDVGDTKDITLNIFYSSPFKGLALVLGIDHNSEYEGVNRVHFCIGKDISGKDVAFWYSYISIKSSSSGWKGSEMYTWLNEDFYNALPSDLTNVISPCTKYTDNTGNTSNVEGNVTATSDKIFLLSEFEVFGKRSNANQYEQKKQKKYQYYINGASKVRLSQDESSISYWWLRSPACETTSGFVRIDTNGNSNWDFINNPNGVVPCFTIA